MEGREERLKAVGDVLLEKAEIFVRQLEPEKMTPQNLKQMTGFLMELRELQLADGELDALERQAKLQKLQGKENQDMALVVTIGGEEAWKK